VFGRIDAIARKVPGVTDTLTIAGMSLLYTANAPHWGSMFLVLDEYKHRRTPETSMLGIIRAMRQRCQAEVPDAVVGVYPAPSVKGLGTAGGFKFYVQDRGSQGPRVLQESTAALAHTMEQWKLPLVVADYRADSPQYFLDIDRDKIRALGIPIATVFSTLQMDVGSYYVNNFSRFGRSWQVNMQADGSHRQDIHRTLERLKVVGGNKQPVPLTTLIDVRDRVGPSLVMRYNLYSAAAVYGEPGPGVGSTSATAAPALPSRSAHPRARGQCPRAA
jgi:multidrug efflux pump